MKTNKYIYVLALFLFGSAACTSDFEEINTDPNAITIGDASARYFFTNTQVELFGPGRFAYWRAHLLHIDRYAGQFALGHSKSWWNGELGYVYNPGYTDASWDWLASYFGTLDNFMRLTGPGGEFENEKMFAVGQIMKGLYFQRYTDVFGEVPYSQVGDPDNPQPAFDTQQQIYKGVIAELAQAMETIGEASRTGEGIDDLGENDIFFGGDLQLWKKLANSLKLRMAMRAKGAPGENFADKVIAEALQAPLLEAGENALLEKDAVITQWASAAYGDIWHNFGAGSNWKVTNVLVDYLRDFNDPRLEKYAKPAPGGEVSISRPDGLSDELWQKRTGFILSVLDDAEADYNKTETADELAISMAPGTYYIGMPARLRPEMNRYAAYNLFSDPADYVTQKKNEGKPIVPEIAFSAAESFFLRAEAAVKGFGGGDPQALYQKGIQEAMLLWGVDEAAISDFLANSPMASLQGTEEEQIRKISIQRWLASYTEGYEAWSIARRTGYPEELTSGVAALDPDIYGMGGINGAFPQRMQYGNSAKATNGENLQEALSRQGPDAQDTKLWWAK